MKVDYSKTNDALRSLIDNYAQILPIDANLLIPSDRSKVLGNQAVLDLETYKKFWLKLLVKVAPRKFLFHRDVSRECFCCLDVC